jgi:hypothetical protein
MCISASVIAAVGVAASVAGSGAAIYGAYQQGENMEKVQAEQKKQEGLRQQQMSLEAMRKKREIIRQSTLARATSLSTATNQGGAESSGFAGALGTISGAAGRSSLATSQNQELGNDMFASNARMADFYGAAQSGATIASMGSGVSSLGGALTKNAGTINQVGNYYAPSIFSKPV